MGSVYKMSKHLLDIVSAILDSTEPCAKLKCATVFLTPIHEYVQVKEGVAEITIANVTMDLEVPIVPHPFVILS